MPIWSTSSNINKRIGPDRMVQTLPEIKASHLHIKPTALSFPCRGPCWVFNAPNLTLFRVSDSWERRMRFGSTIIYISLATYAEWEYRTWEYKPHTPQCFACSRYPHAASVCLTTHVRGPYRLQTCIIGVRLLSTARISEGPVEHKQNIWHVCKSKRE